MIVRSIAELAPASCRAVVINVSTKEVSTLAVLSTLRRLNRRDRNSTNLDDILQEVLARLHREDGVSFAPSVAESRPAMNARMPE